MSRSPTYVGRLDPQFRRFVNVVNLYPTSSTSSIDDKDEAVTSLASSSCSEKLPEFLTVDAYTEDSLPQTQGQREVSEFFLEYVNVLSSGSETSFVTDDQEIATSATNASWRENTQSVSNSEQRYRQDRIASDCFQDDSVFSSDANEENFYSENGINYCLQKRPGVSNERHGLNRPVSGSFSSEADSERNYTYRNEAGDRLEDFEGFPARKYSQRKENINSVPWLRGQEVISRSRQDTSRKMDDSFDDSYSVDSEICYSSDVIVDGYSSTSSADSSFVCFALVGKEEDERTKRKVASNSGRRDRHKKYMTSKDSSRRPESEGKKSDHGVAACVVSGISGGPAIRMYRDKDSKKSLTKPSDIKHLHKFKKALLYEREAEHDRTESNALKGSQFRHERSENVGRGFVFGVFGTPGSPALEEEQSDRVDETPLNQERGASIYDLENVNAYSGRLSTFPGNDLQTLSKPSVERENDRSAIEYDSPRDDMMAISNAAGKKSSLQSSTEHKWNKLSNKKSSKMSGEVIHSSLSQWTDEPRLSHVARQRQMTDICEDGKDLPSPEIEIESKARGGEVNERPIPLQLHSVGLKERKREVRVSAISRSPQESRLRKRLLEEKQHRMVPEKVKPQEAGNSSKETDGKSSHREHDLNDGRFKDLSKEDKDVKVWELPPSFDSINDLVADPSKKWQDSQTTAELEPKMVTAHDETLLITDGVQESISYEYNVDEVKSELLTPVKQTIRESIRARFFDDGNCGDTWKMSPNEEDQVYPESGGDGMSETKWESDKQHKAMGVAEGLRTKSEDILMQEDSLEDSFDIDHTETTPNPNSADSVLENQNENILAMRANLDMDHKRDASYDPRSSEDEVGAKENCECDPMDYDMSDDLNEHDSKISSVVDHFDLDSVFPSGEDGNGRSIPGSHDVTTDETVDAIDTWKPDSAICQESEVEDNHLQSKREFDVGFRSMEESSGGQHRARKNKKVIVSKSRKGEDTSPPFGSQQGKCTHEAKRKSPEEEKQETKYSKKIKSLSEASPKGDELPLQSSDEFNSTGKSLSRKTFFDRPEETSATANEIPPRLLDEGQPSGKEKESKKYVSKREWGEAKSFEKEKAKESGHSNTKDVMEPSKYVEEFRSGSSPVLITSEAYVLIKDGVKNRSPVRELNMSRNIASTATQAAAKDELQDLAPSEICGPFDSNLSDHSTEQFIEESPEVSANGSHSSSSALLFMKSTSHPDIKEMETAVSTSKVERKGKRISLKDDNLNRSFREDESKTTNYPSIEDRYHSIKMTENVELKGDDQRDVKMDPSICEVKDIAAEAPDFSTAEVRDIDSLNGSADECNVRVNHTEFSDAKEEIFNGIGAIGTVLPLSKTVDVAHVSSRSLSFNQKDKDIDTTGPQTAPETTEASEDKLCVTEDVCFVSLDDSNKQSEDGAWDAAEPMSTSDLDEAVVFSTKPNFVGSELPEEGNTFLEERETDQNEDVSDKVLISDDKWSNKNEVEEVICSYQEPAALSKIEWNPSNRLNKVRLADSDSNANSKTDAESNVWFSTGVKDGDTRMGPSDMSGPSAESFRRIDAHLHNTETQMDETAVCQEVPMPKVTDSLDNEDGFPFGFKTRTSEISHCDCLQEYLLQHSQDKESEYKKEPFASSYTLEKLDKDPSLHDVDGVERFGAIRINGYFSDTSVKEVFDKQCQVELLKDYALPECKAKESQTSFMHSTVNRECQTNESTEEDFVPGALQQSAECQTELPSNFYASCGVQVECFDYTFQGSAPERKDNVIEHQMRQDEKCRYTDKYCQTWPDYVLILTSSKQCQTVHCSEEPLRFPVDRFNASLDGTEASRNVSSEDKECQTSENYPLLFISSESASKKFNLSHFVSCANKECQTSCDNMLVTSSAQCDILPSSHGEEVPKETEAPRVPSHENKECQTLPDVDLLFAASKFCQTSSWSYAPEEIPIDYTNAGDEGGTLYDSKECQTLLESSLPLMSSKGCQTIVKFASDVADTTYDALQSIAYNSKECQTTSDPITNQNHPLLNLIEAIEVEFNVQSTQTDDTLERNAAMYESKDSQTTPDQDLLISSSKICQTMNFEPTIAFMNRETQTVPERETFLASSKECQTIPFGLKEQNSEPPDEAFKSTEDMELSNVAIAGEYSASPQMTSLQRPVTYGKSPEATDASFFGVQSDGGLDASDLSQTNIELVATPVGSSLAIDVSEKGCQAMLCNCGSCASDPQSGYFFSFFYSVC